jgi:protocatechuate 4,5-dioxygenase alpha chain
MALDKPYLDIPGTTVFDAVYARKGYHLNQFCMSLMKDGNRQAFRADERGYLDQWPMSEEQKQGVLDRDFNRLISLGGNIYFLIKISSSDGLSVLAAVSSMTEHTPEQYAQMMQNGGRSPAGNRYISEPQ